MNIFSSKCMINICIIHMYINVMPRFNTAPNKRCIQKTIFLIATDKALFSIRKMVISFLFLHENICCGYSLEVPQRGTSNEYPQHVFVEK